MPLLFRSAAQFISGSRITRLILEPADGCCSPEYTPARSAERHRPEAHCRRAPILSPAVTATGTTFWAVFDAHRRAFSTAEGNSLANSAPDGGFEATPAEERASLKNRDARE